MYWNLCHSERSRGISEYSSSCHPLSLSAWSRRGDRFRNPQWRTDDWRTGEWQGQHDKGGGTGSVPPTQPEDDTEVLPPFARHESGPVGRDRCCRWSGDGVNSRKLWSQSPLPNQRDVSPALDMTEALGAFVICSTRRFVASAVLRFKWAGDSVHYGAGEERG
jgi:hypothetical protein